MAHLGGLAITRAEWLGTTALRVEFSTVDTGQLFQLYAGRKRIGVTSDVSERAVIGQLQPSLYPQHLTLVAVDPADKETDYGDELPKRPYNCVRLTFTISGWPSDAAFVDVVGSTEPGGAVDQDNLLVRQPYDTDRVYTATTPALPGSGDWDFEVTGRDNRPSGGNEGPALELSANILAHPPDVALNESDGSRLSVSVAGGVATIGFTPQF